MVLDHGFTHSLVLKFGLGLWVNSSKERVTGRVLKGVKNWVDKWVKRTMKKR